MRGVEYPSIAGAARAAGVTPRNAQKHLDTYGHLDFLGTEKARRMNRTTKPVTIGGVTFASRAEAAEQLGISKATLWRAMFRPKDYPRAAQTVMIAAMSFGRRSERENY